MNCTTFASVISLAGLTVAGLGIKCQRSMRVTPTSQAMLQDGVSSVVVLAADATCHCPNVSYTACYTVSSDPSMDFQNTAVSVHGRPMHLSSHFVCDQGQFACVVFLLALQAR